MKQWLVNKIGFIIIICTTIFGIVLYEPLAINLIDEITLLILFCFYFIISLTHNGSIGKGLFVFLVVFLFYFFYSLVINVTVPAAVLADFLQQAKPYLAFFSFYYLGVSFSKKQGQILRFTVLTLFSVLVIASMLGVLDLFFGHPTTFASCCFSLSILYYTFNHSKKSDLLISIIILSLGLLSGRSKFYGVFIIASFVLLFVRHRIVLSFRTLIISLFVFVVVVIAAWSKLNLYVVEGFSSDWIARPVLYKNAVNVLNDYFPFGSGFGTYGNEASRDFYSPLYYKYDLYKVWGLSPSYDKFVADTFFPVLSQFGYIGIMLFVVFWYRLWKLVDYKSLAEKIVEYKIGLIIIAFFLIESIADTTIVSYRGLLPMMILGYVLSPKRASQLTAEID